MNNIQKTQFTYEKDTDFNTPFTHENDPVYQSKITDTNRLITILANDRFSENKWNIFRRCFEKTSDIETIILTFIHAKNFLSNQNKIEKVFEMYNQFIPQDYKASVLHEIEDIIAEKRVNDIRDILFGKLFDVNNLSEQLKKIFEEATKTKKNLDDEIYMNYELVDKNNLERGVKLSESKYKLYKKYHEMISKKPFEECVKVYARMKHMNIND